MAIRMLLALALSLATVTLGFTGEEETLAGISGMRVVVENLGKDALTDGLTVDQIKTDAELKLRLAGVRVDSESAPFVYVNIGYLRAETVSNLPLGYIFNVQVGFQQQAILNINHKSAFVTTWHRSFIGADNDRKAGDRVRREVRDIMDRFINDYLAANPKR